jgi:hypothetical protein
MHKNIFLGAVMVLGLISINTAAWAQEGKMLAGKSALIQVVDRITGNTRHPRCCGGDQ